MFFFFTGTKFFQHFTCISLMNCVRGGSSCGEFKILTNPWANILHYHYVETTTLMSYLPIACPTAICKDFKYSQRMRTASITHKAFSVQPITNSTVLQIQDECYTAQWSMPVIQKWNKLSSSLTNPTYWKFLQ